MDIQVLNWFLNKSISDSKSQAFGPFPLPTSTYMPKLKKYMCICQSFFKPNDYKVLRKQ